MVPESYMVRTFFTPPEVPFSSVLGLKDIEFTGDYSSMIDFPVDPSVIQPSEGTRKA